MKRLFIVLLAVPLLVSAQTGGETTVGDMVVQYDSSAEKDSGVLYYASDSLVLSEHDGVTLVYQDGTVVLEAHDTDDDGTLDAYLTLDENGEVLAMAGPGVAFFERPSTVEFEELLGVEMITNDSTASNQDLVGSLDAITIPRYHNWSLYVVGLLFLIGGGFWWTRRTKKDNS